MLTVKQTVHTERMFVNHTTHHAWRFCFFFCFQCKDLLGKKVKLDLKLGKCISIYVCMDVYAISAEFINTFE